MTTESDWALKVIERDWPGTYPGDLRRINRDNSENVATNIRDRKAELVKANYVDIGAATRSTTPTGTEYDLKVEQVLDVRVVGLHESEYGHITDSDSFLGLVQDIKTALYANRRHPDVGRPDMSYHTLELENEDDRSGEYYDFYDYRFSIRLRGYEDLSAA